MVLSYVIRLFTRFAVIITLYTMSAHHLEAQQTVTLMPSVISYQGFLTDSLGVPRTDSAYPMRFTLYDSSGTNLWQEMQTVLVNKGGFTVYLGNVNPLTPTLSFAKQYFLGVKAGNDPMEMSPRTPLASSPYAFRADTASYTFRADTASAALALAGGAVTSVNTFKGDVTLAAGNNITITPSGNTLTIASSGGSVDSTPTKALAWVRVDTAGAIKASFGVDSVRRNGAGMNEVYISASASVDTSAMVPVATAITTGGSLTTYTTSVTTKNTPKIFVTVKIVSLTVGTGGLVTAALANQAFDMVLFGKRK